MIPDATKGYVYGAVGVLVAALALGNWFLYGELQEARDDKVIAVERGNAAAEVAGKCSQSVTRLQEEAERAAELAAPQIAAAAETGKQHTATGVAILSTPMSKPDDQCKSMIDFALGWHRARAPK